MTRRQVDPITASLAAKQQHKRELAALLTGRARQPRDRLGRFASFDPEPGGFDGGARRPLVIKQPDPVRAHNQLLLELLRTRQADAGPRF